MYVFASLCGPLYRNLINDPNQPNVTFFPDTTEWENKNISEPIWKTDPYIRVFPTLY